MNQERRDFLRHSSLALASTLIPTIPRSGAADASPTSPPSPLWPIVQGMTDATSAGFVIMHPRTTDFSIVAQRMNDRRARPVNIISREKVPGTAVMTTEILVTGLQPGMDFQLSLIDSKGQILDQRLFRSLDLSQRRARFAVVSCMHDMFSRSAVSMWQTLSRENPDFVVFLGDTVYADTDNSAADEAGYGRRYAQTRNALAWFRAPRLIPSFATWDDHDYGLDNSDRDFPMAAVTKRLFRQFWGCGFNLSCRSSFGVGSVFEAFGQRFYLMDDRSERDPVGTRLGRQWGQTQTDWLLQELASSDQPAWLMNGSQYFGGYLGAESFEGDHAGDFDDLLRQLSRVTAPVCFVSGDVHFSEIMQIEAKKLGYTTYELTSSSMHSYIFPWHQHRAYNPRRLVSTWKYNFLMIDSDVSEGWRIGVRSVLDGHHTAFAQNLRIQR